MRCSPPARNSASSPPAWARATRCAWKPRWRSTATKFDATITPWEADLAWIVKLDKGDFIGRDALVKQKEQGITRKLIGFEMKGRGIGRDGYEVYVDGAAAGWVTSGGPAPTLNKNIGLCYLPVNQCEIGRVIHVMVRNQPVEAVTVPTPFYKRAK